MRWEKIKYPFSWIYNDKEYMPKAEENFWKFITYAEITRMNRFSFGWNMSRVFLGENPRFNSYIYDTCFTPDHANYIYEGKNGERYVVGFPYHNYNLKESEISDLKKFCNKCNVSCAVFPEEYSFYHNAGTIMIVFAHKKVLEELVKKYQLDRNKILFVYPTVSFYKYVMNYEPINLPEGDLARDMKSDKDMPKDIDNDMEVFSYLDFTINDFRAEKVYKKLKKEYLESKFEIR